MIKVIPAFFFVALLAVSAPVRSYAGPDAIGFAALLQLGLYGAAFLAGGAVVATFDSMNTEGPSELASDRMKGSGNGISAGYTMAIIPNGGGLNARFFSTLVVPNAEWGVGYTFSGEGPSFHEIRIDTRIFPFHKLTKGVFFGLSEALRFYQPSWFGAATQLRSGYRIDLYPVYLEPSLELEWQPLVLGPAVYGGPTDWAMRIHWEAGFHF